MHHHIIHILAVAAFTLLPFVFSMTLTPPTPNIIGKSTTIVWGCAPGGTDLAPIVDGMTVTSCDLTPRNAGPVGSIENPDGAIIESIYLDDGFEGTVEGIYDTALTYPAQGDPVTLTLPVATDLSGGSTHTVFPCVVESNPIKFERKKEAMISFKISHAPGRDGAATS